MRSIYVLAAVVGLGFGATAQAASYTFEYSFDGTSASLVAGSDVPDGTSLVDGDDFTLSIGTVGGAFWEVTEAVVNAFVPLSFAISESGNRLANLNTSWLLGGVEVDSRTDTGIIQSEVHMGAQHWDLALGLQFDEVVLNYTLIEATEVGSTNPVGTTISQFSSDFILEDSHTFYAGGPSKGEIEYKSGMAPVPLPAGMALYLPILAVGGFTAMRRRKRG